MQLPYSVSRLTPFFPLLCSCRRSTPAFREVAKCAELKGMGLPDLIFLSFVVYFFLENPFSQYLSHFRAFFFLSLVFPPFSASRLVSWIFSIFGPGPAFSEGRSRNSTFFQSLEKSSGRGQRSVLKPGSDSSFSALDVKPFLPYCALKLPYEVGEYFPHTNKLFLFSSSLSVLTVPFVSRFLIRSSKVPFSPMSLCP